jgi:O-antigen/teichoic acid export membrane protein
MTDAVMPHPTESETTVQTSKVARNASILILGQLIVQGSMAVTGILVARRLGEVDYGRYALAFTFIGMFGLLLNLGSDALIVRQVARRSEDDWQTVSAGLWLRVLCFPLTLLLTQGVALVAGYDAEQQKYILLAMLIMGLISLTDLPRAVFQGYQRMTLDTVTRAVEKLGALGLTALVIFMLPNPSLDGVMLAIFGGAVVSLILSTLLIRTLIGQPRFYSINSGWALARTAVPVGGSMFITSLYLQLPTVLLSLFVPIAGVGHYNAANSLVQPFMLLPVAVGTALLPALASATRLGAGGVRRHYGMTALSLVLGLPITIGLALFADFLLRLLYGAAFTVATPTLMILAFMVPLVFVNTYLTNFAIAHDRQHLLPIITLSTLILTVVFCLLLVPFLGAPGIALGRVLAEVGNMIVGLVLTTRSLKHTQSETA